MTAYKEFVKGSHFFKDMIVDADSYESLDENCFYPVIVAPSDRDEPMMAEVTQLPKEKIKIYTSPQEPPAEVTAYVESDWAFYVYEVE